MSEEQNPLTWKIRLLGLAAVVALSHMPGKAPADGIVTTASAGTTQSEARRVQDKQAEAHSTERAVRTAAPGVRDRTERKAWPARTILPFGR